MTLLDLPYDFGRKRNKRLHPTNPSGNLARDKKSQLRPFEFSKIKRRSLSPQSEPDLFRPQIENLRVQGHLKLWMIQNILVFFSKFISPVNL